MDATRRKQFPAFPAQFTLKGAVLAFVMLLHVLAMRLLPPLTPPPDPATPMVLTYVLLPPIAKPAPAQASKASGATAHAATGADPAPRDLPAQPRAPALQAVTTTALDDEWAATTRASRSDDIRFDRRSPMASFNPMPPSPPTRFTLREQASLANFLRAVAQALLWPPGYSDDPCEGLAEAADMLREMPGEGRRDLLEDVVRKQGQYCD